jgi:peptidoglycan/LPS O-acetylase OafA/YrhL
LRLGPALLAFVLIAAPGVLALRHEADQIVAGTLTSLFYVADFAQANVGPFPRVATAYEPLWSLAIEEQFYLLWPAVLIFGLARLSRRGRAVALVAAIVVAQTLQVYFHFVLKGANFFFPTGHFVALAIGVLAAELAVHGAPRWATRLISSARFCGGMLLFWCLLVVATYGRAREMTDFGITAAVSAASAALILHSLIGTSVVTRVLELGWLRWFGQRSYGLYLYQIPVLLLLSPPVADVRFAARLPLFFVGSMALAELSSRYLERPVILRGRMRLAAGRRHEAQVKEPEIGAA